MKIPLRHERLMEDEIHRVACASLPHYNDIIGKHAAVGEEREPRDRYATVLNQ